MNDDSDDDRPSPLSHILQVVMQLAAGDFSARAVDSGNGDELDALAVGIQNDDRESAIAWLQSQPGGKP